ncbi:MAG: hypothetical protein RI573_15180, partial [Balneolaceae bacterium]|nr:hypothetical protein [Balneolaceae bacterium]
MNLSKETILNSDLHADFLDLINEAPSVTVAKNIEDLVNLSVGGEDELSQEVTYELPNGEFKKEAIVHRVKNGIAA